LPHAIEAADRVRTVAGYLDIKPERDERDGKALYAFNVQL
jgi:hypothetical protein